MNDATRRTIRTTVQMILSLAAITPLVLSELDLEDTATGAAVITITAGITRVMQLPRVEEFLERYVPWLAAQNRPIEPLQPPRETI